MRRLALLLWAVVAGRGARATAAGSHLAHAGGILSMLNQLQHRYRRVLSKRIVASIRGLPPLEYGGRGAVP